MRHGPTHYTSSYSLLSPRVATSPYLCKRCLKKVDSGSGGRGGASGTIVSSGGGLIVAAAPGVDVRVVGCGGGTDELLQL
jgi:hypothetical protein